MSEGIKHIEIRTLKDRIRSKVCKSSFYASSWWLSTVLTFAFLPGPVIQACQAKSESGRDQSSTIFGTLFVVYQPLSK
jgi:hypothetical protein